jgi:hypothetical protein
MPIGGYASNAVEKETIVTPRRAVMEIEGDLPFLRGRPRQPGPL